MTGGELQNRANDLALGGLVELELRPIGGARWSSVEPEVRLRRALKALGRTFGLQVVRVERRRPADRKVETGATENPSTPPPLVDRAPSSLTPRQNSDQKTRRDEMTQRDTLSHDEDPE